MSHPPEPIELEDPLPDHGRSSEAVAHYTFESFYQAVARPSVSCRTCRGFADAIDHLRGCPTIERISAAAARAGLRAAYGKVRS